MKFKEWLLLTEAKKSSDIARELLGNNETLFNQIKAIIPTDIKQDLQAKLLPIAAYYYKKQPNTETLKQDIKNYADLVKNQKMPIITVNDDLTISNEFKDYLHWTQVIHGKQAEEKILKAPVPQGNLEDQELIEQSPDGKIKVYKANSVNQCIILGKGESFCISKPANTMFQSYRDSKVSTFYFVYDNTRTDDLAIVVVDATEHGIELTDRKNQTASAMQDPYSNTPNRIKSDPELYFKYLQQHGINTDIFVNIPKTKQEEKEQQKLGEQKYGMKWFKSLTPEEKSKYIGRGHQLSNEQFDYLYDNKFMLPLSQYVATGKKINNYQLEKIAKVRDLKDKYLHNRLIADQHLKDLSKQEYDLLSPKQKEEFFSSNDFNVKLEKATKTGNLEKVKEAIKDGATIFGQDIFDAAKNGHLDIVKYLVDEKKIDIPESAVYRAVKNGHLDVVKYLVDEKGQDISVDSVFFAAANGHLDMVKYLVGKGKSIDGEEVSNAAKNGHLDIVKYLVEKGAKISDNTVYVAAQDGHLDVLKYLVGEKGVNINSAAEDAVKNDHLDVVKYLVEKGASINDNVWAASYFGSLDILKYLVDEKGAYIKTMLFYSVKNPKIKDYLIQKQKEQQ